MIEAETLISALLITALYAIAFLWGMRTGKRLENKEVKKVAGFLLTCKKQGTFESPQTVDVAYILAKWLADDNRRADYFPPKRCSPNSIRKRMSARGLVTA